MWAILKLRFVFSMCKASSTSSSFYEASATLDRGTRSAETTTKLCVAFDHLTCKAYGIWERDHRGSFKIIGNGGK